MFHYRSLLPGDPVEVSWPLAPGPELVSSRAPSTSAALLCLSLQYLFLFLLRGWK